MVVYVGIMGLPGPEQPLDEWVKFTGGPYGDDLRAYLATDVAVAPDPCNDFNDKITMIEILEYQASGLPVVLYESCSTIWSKGADPPETPRSSPGETARSTSDRKSRSC